ncbi:hypothetical protein EMPS_08875 [Entomortierella parvispora]|uniref:Uncharacterized protein n=1 Tax=Entomortierella parvispora TaxID=205924 RepID=A0A9P3HH71_9FUNG|nr:hypothetical protein EMPS_08875 [Entomortierella parvispora]
MGNSASKSAASGAKSAARHFPSAASLQERTATATSVHASAKANANAAHASMNSSPKQDYLAQQKQLEEEIARYDREIGQSDKIDGESRPLEDTPSAAEMQFFGNLRTIGQVKVDDPDQVKHHEAEAILKRKLPQKSTSSSSSNNNNNKTIPSSTGAFTPFSSSSTVQSAASTGSTLTSLKLMNILQLRNRDPSVWTLDRLSEEFDIKKADLKALTKYINTYTILPGKDAKGREAGVWCEDIRGVEILERPSVVTEAEEAAGIVRPPTASSTSKSTAAASSSSSSSSSSAAKSATGERRTT